MMPYRFWGKANNKKQDAGEKQSDICLTFA
jgi:hypothetical protein